jgi:hypothetical protein
MNRLLPIAFMVIAVGIFFGYVRPLWTGEISASRTQISNYNKALEAASNFTAQEAKLETARNNIPQADLDRVEAFLPDGVNNVQLILDLNALASRTGMVLSNFGTDASVNGSADSGGGSSGSFGSSRNPVDSLTLTVTGTGTYDAFRSFLSGVEQSLRPLDVTSLTVSDSATGIYTYQMTFTFYWLL